MKKNTHKVIDVITLASQRISMDKLWIWSNISSLRTQGIPPTPRMYEFCRYCSMFLFHWFWQTYMQMFWIEFWHVDHRVRASNHITFNRNWLTNTKTLPYPMLISLPNGYRIKVTELGDVLINSRIILYKVLYVPSFKYNLISIHSLATSMKSIVLFINALCLLQASSVKSLWVINNCKDGLYFLCSRCL